MSSVVARANDAMRGLRMACVNGGYGGEIAFRSHGEPRLDNVHAHFIQA